MAHEFERKYLVRDDSWLDDAHEGMVFRQGYLPGSKTASVRVRLSGDKAYLNIKSSALSVIRKEFDYEIPVHDAEDMLDNFCERPLIEKIRYHVAHAGRTWEVDVFEGENDGLVIAEIELDAPDESFELPGWAGEDVSDDPRYYNPNLVKHPYKSW